MNILDFVDDRIEQMLTRPLFWGPLPSVELLEVRQLLLGKPLIEAQKNLFKRALREFVDSIG